MRSLAAGRRSSLGAARLWVRDYSLSIVAGAIFVVVWMGAAITGWFEFAATQRAHHEAAHLFGSDGYIWEFGEQTLQNWQSEFLVVALLVALSSVLLHRGSQQSRDSDDERRRRVVAIGARVDAAIARHQEGS
jgi:hypothetical protein